MDQSVCSPYSNRVYWTKDDIRLKIEKSKVVVFSRGTQKHPRDGFSERALRTAEQCGHAFEVVDVSADCSIRAALQAYSGSPYIPQVYIDGELQPETA